MTVPPLVVVTHPIFPEVRARLEGIARVDVNPGPEAWGADQVRERCRAATALLAFMTDRVDETFLAACPDLRIVACALKGYDNFDVEACRRAGVAISIVPDLLTIPTAELAVGLTIALGRHVLEGHRRVAAGAFQGWRADLYGVALAGSTVGIVGYGAVGRAIADRLAPFGCELLAFDRAEGPGEGVARRVALDDLLAASDIVILALPLSASTVHLIDEAALSALRPGTLLVNVGRGSVVDELAVAAALGDGRLGGYAADVFAFEDWALDGAPAEIPTALRTAPNTLFTPHIGSAVRAVRLAIEHRAADNVVAFLSHGSAPDAL